MVIVFSSQGQQQGSEALELTLLKDQYSILRFDPASSALDSLSKLISAPSPPSSGVSPDSALFSLSISPREISLVGPTSALFGSDGRWCRSNECSHPQAVEGGWLALRVEPPSSGNSALGEDSSTKEQTEGGQTLPPGIDFSVVGIMARISGSLAGVGVSLFAISTFDTDYILVKEQKIGIAVHALQENGCRVSAEDLERGPLQ